MTPDAVPMQGQMKLQAMPMLTGFYLWRFGPFREVEPEVELGRADKDKEEGLP